MELNNKGLKENQFNAIVSLPEASIFSSVIINPTRLESANIARLYINQITGIRTPKSTHDSIESSFKTEDEEEK